MEQKENETKWKENKVSSTELKMKTNKWAYRMAQKETIEKIQ